MTFGAIVMWPVPQFAEVTESSDITSPGFPPSGM